MDTPQGCPFCLSKDIRLLTSAEAELRGYYCHDCQRTFYATEIRAVRSRGKPPGAVQQPPKRTRKRQAG